MIFKTLVICVAMMGITSGAFAQEMNPKEAMIAISRSAEAIHELYKKPEMREALGKREMSEDQFRKILVERANGNDAVSKKLAEDAVSALGQRKIETLAASTKAVDVSTKARGSDVSDRMIGKQTIEFGGKAKNRAELLDVVVDAATVRAAKGDLTSAQLEGLKAVAHEAPKRIGRGFEEACKDKLNKAQLSTATDVLIATRGIKDEVAAAEAELETYKEKMGTDEAATCENMGRLSDKNECGFFGSVTHNAIPKAKMCAR